jgi:hypothetical protein
MVFAASVTPLATKIDQIMLSSAEVVAKAPFAPISIISRVLADEAMTLFKWRGSMIAIPATNGGVLWSRSLRCSRALSPFGNPITAANKLTDRVTPYMDSRNVELLKRLRGKTAHELGKRLAA